MPVLARLKSILIIIAVVCSTKLSFGQVITTGSDSTIVSTTTSDTLSTGILGALKTWDKPSRAALFSAIIPGGGQFYNKRYWKIPIIYAGGITIGYFFIDNHQKYLLYRSSLEILNNGGEDLFAKVVPDKNERFQRLSRFSQNFRRYRDYNIIFMLLLYGLNIGEAYVDAHLKGFDISDDLGLQLEPTLIPGPYLSYTPGLSVKLNLKK